VITGESSGFYGAMRILGKAVSRRLMCTAID
jgi:hypothetical protein